MPHFRFLAFGGNKIIGHLGMDHRMISIGGCPYSSFGIVDLCVHNAHRRQHIGIKLLSEALTLAGSYRIDFVMLFADDHRLYKRTGFEVMNRRIQWLKINEHATLGIGNEKICNICMIKGIGSKVIPSGDIDLLGYLF